MGQQLRLVGQAENVAERQPDHEQEVLGSVSSYPVDSFRESLVQQGGEDKVQAPLG